MSRHYFTFGVGQEHENGYHVIEAHNVVDARKIMAHRFGMKWAFQYPSAETAGIEEFNLHEVFHEESTP